jgi:uncharacterized membrane protein YeaQ/YmgE (transglycosylase-associated protein family)
MFPIVDLDSPTGWIGALISGCLAGFGAEKLAGIELGLNRNIISGIVGSVIDGFRANAARNRIAEFANGCFSGNFRMSVTGAGLLLTVPKLSRGC